MNHTPEPVTALSAVNTCVLGSFKSINRISEVLSASLLFFTDVVRTPSVVIFLQNNFSYSLRFQTHNKSDKISTCISSTKHIEMRHSSPNNFKCQNLTICQKVVSAVGAVDVLHVALWFRSFTCLYVVRWFLLFNDLNLRSFPDIGVCFRLMSISNAFIGVWQNFMCFSHIVWVSHYMLAISATKLETEFCLIVPRKVVINKIQYCISVKFLSKTLLTAHKLKQTLKFASFGHGKINIYEWYG